MKVTINLSEFKVEQIEKALDMDIKDVPKDKIAEIIEHALGYLDLSNYEDDFLDIIEEED